MEEAKERGEMYRVDQMSDVYNFNNYVATCPYNYVYKINPNSSEVF